MVCLLFYENYDLIRLNRMLNYLQIQILFLVHNVYIRFHINSQLQKPF